MKKVVLILLFAVNSILVFLAVLLLIHAFGRKSGRVLSAESVVQPSGKQGAERPRPLSPPSDDAAAQVLILEKKPDFAVLRITSDPPEAKIFINGYFKGRTPAEIKIVDAAENPKRFSLKLMLPGYRVSGEEIFLKKGDRKEYSQTLSK